MTAPTIDRDTYADLGGSTHIASDAPCAFHPRCDGTGHLIADDPDDAIPLACPEHRRHIRQRKTTRRSDINRPRLIVLD